MSLMSIVKSNPSALSVQPVHCHRQIRTAHSILRLLLKPVRRLISPTDGRRQTERSGQTQNKVIVDSYLCRLVGAETSSVRIWWQMFAQFPCSDWSTLLACIIFLKQSATLFSLGRINTWCVFWYFICTGIENINVCDCTVTWNATRNIFNCVSNFSHHRNVSAVSAQFWYNN